MPQVATDVNPDLMPVQIHTHHPYLSADPEACERLGVTYREPKKSADEIFTHFTLIIGQACSQARISRGGIMTALTIISYGDNAFATHQDMCHRMDLSESTLRKGISELKRAGFLEVIPQGDDRNRHANGTLRKSCAYRFRIPEVAWVPRKGEPIAVIPQARLDELEADRELLQTSLLEDVAVPVASADVEEPQHVENAQLVDPVDLLIPEVPADVVRQAIADELLDAGHLDRPVVVGPPSPVVRRACQAFLSTCRNQWRSVVRHVAQHWGSIRDVMGRTQVLPDLSVFLTVARVLHGRRDVGMRALVEALEDQSRVQLRPRMPWTKALD